MTGIFDRQPITLDQSELLGLSQIAKISPETAKSGPAELSRLLSKIGENPARGARFVVDRGGGWRAVGLARLHRN